MDLHEQQLQILQNIHKEMLIISQRDQDCASILKDQIKELRMITVGLDGSNGLRSVSKQHDIDIAELKKWRTQFMAVFASIQLIGVPMLVFFLQKFIK